MGAFPDETSSYLHDFFMFTYYLNQCRPQLFLYGFYLWMTDSDVTLAGISMTLLLSHKSITISLDHGWTWLQIHNDTDIYSFVLLKLL